MIRVALARLVDAGEPLGLLLGLSLATARNAVDVAAMRLRPPDSDADDVADPDYWLDLDAGMIEHPSALPPLSYDPDPQAREALHAVAQWVRIALPPPLIAAARALLQPVAADDLTLGEVLGLDPDTVKTQVQVWCEAIRRTDPRIRLSPARLREWPIYRALYLSRDIALVAQFFHLEIPGSAILYYAHFPAEPLQTLHARVMSEVFDGEASGTCDAPAIGSRLAVRPDVLRAWIVRWHQALRSLEETRSLSGIIACHNALVRYTLALLMRWSGHRAVNDPFDAMDRFDETTGTVLIADKETGDAQQARLAWLPPLAFAQLRAYRVHLQALSGRIASDEPVLAGRIARAGEADADLSLFFFLDADSEAPVPSMVTPSRLKADLALPVPLYFGRNELSRTLRAQGLEAEYVEYQLNHAQRGQELLGSWSTLRVAEVGAALIPLLARGAEEEGWSVLSGLRPHRSTPGAHARPQVTWVPGPMQRARDRIARRRALTGRLRETLRTAPPGPWDRAAVDVLGAEIHRAFPQPGERRSAFRLARRWALRQHPEARRAMERAWPQRLDVPAPPELFRLDDGLNLHAYRRCREALRGWLLRLSEGDAMADWDGALLACALLEDCLLADALLAQLPRAARTQAFSCADIAWIDLAETAYDPPATRRLFLTPATGLLVIRLRNRHPHRSSPFAVATQAAVEHLLPGGRWDQLRAIAATGARYRLSGVEHGYARGELTAASLPVTALLRLLTGWVVTGSPVEPMPAEPRRAGVRKRQASEGEPDYQRGLRYRAALRRQLHDIVAGEARLADPRRQLARVLDRLEPIARDHAPPVMVALIAWVRQLLEQGRTKAHLRLSTIRDYYLAVARYLYEAAWTVQDFAALDDDELESINTQALDYTSWEQRPATAELLRDVHNTLRRLYPGTPSVDFHHIEPRVKGRAVRSNLLTLTEYARARQQLDLAERVALTCLYRLGLRPGSCGVWGRTMSGSTVSPFSMSVAGAGRAPKPRRASDRFR